MAALTEPQGQGPAKRESAGETISRMGEKHPMEDPESVGQLLRNALKMHHVKRDAASGGKAHTQLSAVLSEMKRYVLQKKEK